MRAARRQVDLFPGARLSVAQLRERVEEPNGLERTVQRQLLADMANPLRANGAVLAFHVPNGVPLCGLPAWVRARVWNALRADGARAGAADLVIGHLGRLYLLEVKSEKGSLRASQKAFRVDCEAVGIECHVGFGLADCRRILTELGVFRQGAFGE
jgi:hypothetical protein